MGMRTTILDTETSSDVMLSGLFQNAYTSGDGAGVRIDSAKLLGSDLVFRSN